MEPNESVKKMWNDYHNSIGIIAPEEPISDSFCDNEKDANELAALVNDGIKRATSPALWSFEKTGSKLPVVGEIFIVKDWAGNAVCIVQTRKVTIMPFNEVTEAHAYIEGEGDRSLKYWKEVHTLFYQAELKNLGLKFEESMPIVFEEFERIFP